MAAVSTLRVGTAGWSIPRASAFRCETSGTHLQRYARTFPCVEINSSFYRPHAAATYARWRDSTPAEFRFSVKVPRAITHELKLTNPRDPLAEFLSQTDGLAEKRGPLLVQLAPSLAFDRAVATAFIEVLRDLYEGLVVWEPRHASWFSPEVACLLDKYRISRVAADPPPVPTAALPAGWPRLVYFRLHGSPRTYWSRYDEAFVATLAMTLRDISMDADAWCVFDNTASGAAIENAWELRDRLMG